MATKKKPNPFAKKGGNPFAEKDAKGKQAACKGGKTCRK